MKFLKESYAAKVFIALAIFIAFICLSLIVFYVYHQKNSLKEGMISKGHLLARILANNIKIGVFSENLNLLQDPIKGIFDQEDVIAFLTYNQDGKLLSVNKNPLKTSLAHNIEIENNQPIDKLRNSHGPYFVEKDTLFEFYAPVMLNSEYSENDKVYLGNNARISKKTFIGFIKLMLDKSLLYEKTQKLLIKGILISVLYIVLSTLSIFFIINGITRPLNNLMTGVKELENNYHIHKVPVETLDEFGKLANAFNNMAQTLAKRENDLKNSETQLRFLSAKLLQVQEQERKRIAKELHDELGQALVVMKHRQRSIQKKVLDSRDIYDECQELCNYVDQTIENVRRLSKELSPSILEDLGLTAALKWLLDSFQKENSIQVSTEIINVDQLLSKEEQINLFRIFQESLTNILKHADATTIKIAIKNSSPWTSFSISDDGKGFNYARAMKRTYSERGMGLVAMHERANIIGAKLDISTEQGKGTTIKLLIPVSKS